MTRIDRLKVIRAHQGLSAQAWSMKLGISYNLWCQYEAGRKEPSASTLEKMTQQGYSLDWLFTGRGPMLLPWSEAAQQKPEDSIKGAVGVAQIAQQVEQVLASMSDHWLPVWQAVLGALEANPAGLSLEALEARLPQFESKRIITELERMSKDGIVGVAQGRYRLLTGLVKPEHNTAEFRALIGVRELLTVHLPVFSERSGKGRIDIAAIHLKCGAALEVARRLWRLIEGWKQSYAEQLKGVDEAQLRLVIQTVVIEPSEGTST